LPPNGQLTLNKSICQSQFPVGFLNITAVQGAGTRANPQQQATNVAVPGQTVGDAVSLKPKPITNPATATITDIILGLPGFLATPPIARTQLEWVEALKPTTAVVWIGNNDALGAVGGGSDKLLTPLTDFTTRYTELMRRVKATGATNIFVANIPDVTSIALLLSQDDVAKISNQNKETLQFIFGIGKKDFILPTGLALLPRGQKLPDNVVLTKKEVKVIRKAVEDYNKVIAAQAAANGATLVDTNKLLADVAKDGVTIDGIGKITTRPFGGLFSLDFVHPSNTGYAVAANAFVTAINAKGGKLTPVDLKAVATADPFVCKPGTEFEGEQPLPSLEEFERLAPMIERNLRVLTDPNYPILVPDGR
jgi:lysophospholipase L1-like esterase